MKKEIFLGNERIEYSLKKSHRARNICLSISRGAEISVSVPFYIDETVVSKFISQKAEWILQKIKYFKKNYQKSLLPERSKKEYLKNKRDAYLAILESINRLNKIYNFSWKKISIRNQKSRWGSCSRKGNLNFSYRIIFLPENLRDYIVAHELCHLKEFNHSKKFWNLVSETVPDFKEIRKEIRKKY